MTRKPIADERSYLERGKIIARLEAGGSQTRPYDSETKIKSVGRGRSNPEWENQARPYSERATEKFCWENIFAN